MHRGDTALWVLTKMAMIFFIASLAAILLVFGNLQKTGLCNQEAREISGRVASAMTQLLNSPTEDERRVLQLEPSLALGDSGRGRYVMTLTRHINSGKPYNSLFVKVASEADPNCVGATAVSYPPEFDSSPGRLFFYPAANPPAPGSKPRDVRCASPGCIADDLQAIERMVIRPAVVAPEKEGERSTFIALLKCTQKRVTLASYYFVQDCIKKDSRDCINLDTSTPPAGAPGSPESLCGFT